MTERVRPIAENTVVEVVVWRGEVTALATLIDRPWRQIANICKIDSRTGPRYCLPLALNNSVPMINAIRAKISDSLVDGRVL